MGLFNRFKKTEEVISEVPPIKKPEEIEKERLENELENLKKEVKEKTESFDSISNKLEKVKAEYDSVITKVMSAKREVKEKQTEYASLKSEFDEIPSKIGTAKTQLETMKKQYDEIKSELDKYEKSKSELNSIRIQMEKAKTEQKEIQFKLEKDKEKLSEMLKLDIDYEEIKGKIVTAKKELEFTESQIYASNNRDAPKSIIEAASTMMASLNSQIRKTQQELEIVKKTLELERNANKKSE
jgi:chromosome segregation ATPase